MYNTVLITLFLFATGQCASDFSERARNFSIELLYHTQLETDGHVVLSPLGVWSLLTGISTGATGNSRKELVTALVLPSNPVTVVEGYIDIMKRVLDPNTDGVSMTIKNFMFVDKKFKVKDKFRSTLTRDFGATVEELDFKSPNAAKMANSIIEDSGANVENVLNSDDFTNSRMILTNSISFKGFWNLPFNESDTHVESFYNENRNEIGKVNMMYQRSPFRYSNIKEMSARILELPYGEDQKYCMLVILPYPKASISDVYKQLAQITIPNIFARLQYDEEAYGVEDVDVKLPRFKISTNVVLTRPLNNMGVVDIFDPSYASFERVTNEDIYVSAIIHKANIEVTETGTVASASTSANFANRITPGYFHVDRSFIYFIVEKPSTTVIFSGIYSKPSIY